MTLCHTYVNTHTHAYLFFFYTHVVVVNKQLLRHFRVHFHVYALLFENIYKIFIIFLFAFQLTFHFYILRIFIYAACKHVLKCVKSSSQRHYNCSAPSFFLFTFFLRFSFHSFIHFVWQWRSLLASLLFVQHHFHWFPFVRFAIFQFNDAHIVILL